MQQFAEIEILKRVEAEPIAKADTNAVAAGAAAAAAKSCVGKSL